MKIKNIILVIVLLQFGIINTMYSQKLEYDKTNIKCLEGDCKNGEGLALLIHRYRKHYNSRADEFDYKIALIKGTFINEKLNGFASILGEFNSKEYMKKQEKELKKYYSLKSLIKGKFSLNTDYIIEGNFINNIPTGTMTYYDKNYTYHNNYNGNDKFKEGNSIWQWRKKYECEIADNNLKDKVIGRMFYGKIDREFALRQINIYNNKLPFTQLDSVKINFEGGYLKMGNVKTDKADIWSGVNGLNEDDDYFQIYYKELVLNNEKIIRKKDNSDIDLVTIIKNGEVETFQEHHKFYATKAQDKEKERIAKSKIDHTKKNTSAGNCWVGHDVIIYEGKKALVTTIVNNQVYLSDGRILHRYQSVVIDKNEKAENYMCNCPQCNGGGSINVNNYTKDVETYNKQALVGTKVYSVVKVTEKNKTVKSNCSLCGGTGKVVCK